MTDHPDGLIYRVVQSALRWLHDRWWDVQFARSADALNAMAQEALEEDRAGLTKDLDIKPKDAHEDQYHD